VVKEHTKNKLLLIEGMFAIMILIFVAAFAIDKFFPTPAVTAETGAPQIVGFVPIEIKSQPIDLTAQGPTSFVLFSEKSDLFDLTSFRLSGKVVGEGRAEIVLDNGLGQELLIYSNVKQKQGNLITGMAVTDDAMPLPEGVPVNPVEESQAWLKISPSDVELTELPKQDLGNNKQAVTGEFQHRCVDTCYMNMKMQKGLYYTLKVRTDPETEVNINELKYTLDV